MATKTEIVDFLGDKALLVPAALDAARAANERAKYVLSVLQMAASHAASPQADVPSLRADREACGVADARLDRCVTESDTDGHGTFYIPGAKKLMTVLDDGLNAMLAPLALVAADSPESGTRYARYHDRLEQLVHARPAIADDTVSGETIAAMTSGRPSGGDGFHVLVMDLHKEINRLQEAIATADVEGAKAHGITDADRPLIAAFTRGVKRTAPLKFDHPGLATTAVRSGNTLFIQNDIGTTDAHVLVLRVAGTEAVLTHTDVHLQRLRFLQRMLDGAGMQWDDVASAQGATLAKGDLFYVARGKFAATDAASLTQFLEALGSRLVFLIDWNKARKRLGLLVPNETAVAILRWAADHDAGHRAFLSLGAERLVYDALGQAIKTPLRYGEPLHEMIGVEVAKDYLCYVLQTTASGLLKGRSPALIHDQVRAELFNHFRSAEHRLLADASRHAGVVVEIADKLRTALRQPGVSSADALARNASEAKLAESRADEIVKETRRTVRRIPGTDVFCRLLEVADDAADELEDAAFLAGLFADAPDGVKPPPLLQLADMLADGAQAFQRALDAAQHVRRGGARETMQQFLEAVDQVVTIEHRTDDCERAVTAALIAADGPCRHLHLVSGIASHLESAADALLRASLMLRDHVLGDVMFA